MRHLCADTDSMLQAGTEGITQTIRAMVLSAVVQDGHAAEGLEVCYASLHPALTGLDTLRGDHPRTGDMHDSWTDGIQEQTRLNCFTCAGRID